MEFNYLSGFAIIGLVAIVGAMSPGPDFVIVTKNSLAYSRRTGFYTAFGVSLGVIVHIAYCLMGIGFSIAESPFLFNCIKYCGAAYLIYIGVKALLSKPQAAADDQEVTKGDLTPLQSLKSGFFTNALNPKATLFFLSVFSQVIDPATTLATQIAYGMEIWLIVLGWFCLLAYMLSHRHLKTRLVRAQHYIEKGMGGLLIGFGLKIATV